MNGSPENDNEYSELAAAIRRLLKEAREIARAGCHGHHPNR